MIDMETEIVTARAVATTHMRFDMSAFSWKALQTELSTSSYLLPDDDLSSQRGIIATAIAIADRMTCSLKQLFLQVPDVNNNGPTSFGLSAALSPIAG
jgi:hypothetical protein